MNEQSGPDWLAVLEHDHQIINEQLAILRQALHEAQQQPDSPALHETLRKLTVFFTTDLPWHIRLEEEALFPSLIPALGQTSGPVVAIRMEHEELPQIVAEWEKAWEQFAEAPMQVRLRALLETARHLHGLLAIHLDKEDHVLFPLVRKLLGPQDWAEVQGRAQVLVL